MIAKPTPVRMKRSDLYRQRGFPMLESLLGSDLGPRWKTSHGESRRGGWDQAIGKARGRLGPQGVPWRAVQGMRGAPRCYDHTHDQRRRGRSLGKRGPGGLLSDKCLRATSDDSPYRPRNRRRSWNSPGASVLRSSTRKGNRFPINRYGFVTRSGIFCPCLFLELIDACL